MTGSRELASKSLQRIGKPLLGAAAIVSFGVLLPVSFTGSSYGEIQTAAAHLTADEAAIQPVYQAHDQKKKKKKKKKPRRGSFGSS